MISPQLLDQLDLEGWLKNGEQGCRLVRISRYRSAQNLLPVRKKVNIKKLFDEREASGN
jgi:hypothetical protein